MKDMPQYYGTKKIAAKPMNRRDYNKLRGWELPSDERPEDEGYLVEYLDGGEPNLEGFDGYVSWSPKEQFENAYQPTDALSFGHAILAMKAGHKVTRKGWNGAGQFVYYVPAAKYPASRNTLKTMAGLFENDMVPYRGYFALKTVQNDVVPWLASMSDMIENDWQIV